MAGLGELERAVMEVLWARGAAAEPTAATAGQRRPAATGEPATGATVREVTEALADRGLAYTTVMTVLDRLAGKGMVVRERDGRAWRYQPAATRETYIARLMLDALDLAQPGAATAAGAGGGRGAALAWFARSVSGDEAEVLRAALEEQPRRRPRGKR